ncbi:MAG: DUF4340 domain-containing protein, partial [Algisphaera sp.]
MLVRQAHPEPRVNFRTTALLLLLLLGTAGLYLGTQSSRPSPSPPHRPATVGRPLVKGTAFRRIVIERDGTREAYQLEDNGWWQVQPVRFPVAAKGPDKLINAALSLSPRQTLIPRSNEDTSETLAHVPTRSDLKLGLKADRVIIVTDTTVFNLLLGRREVAGTAWLGLEGDENAYLVDPTLHIAAQSATPQAWRTDRLRAPDADHVAQLTLQQRGQPAANNVVLTRASEGWHWGLTSRDAPRADRDAATALAGIAHELRVLEFTNDASERLAGFGLTDPVATLTLQSAKGSTPQPSTTGETCILRLGRPAQSIAGQPTRYATYSFSNTQASSVVFQIAEASVALLLAPASQFRDARLVTADAHSTIGLRVDHADGRSIELARTHSTETSSLYQFVEPDAKRSADATWGEAWFNTLLKSTATEFCPAPPEAQAPLATVTLRRTADRIEHVRLYADREGRHDVLLAVRENEPIAAIMPADTLSPLFAAPITLHDTRLPALHTPLSVVRLTRPDGITFEFNAPAASPSDDTWSFSTNTTTPPTPPSTAWDQTRFAQLRMWLTAPQAVQWTQLAELPRGPVARLSTGPNEPAYIVNVEQNIAQRTDLPGVFRI